MSPSKIVSKHVASLASRVTRRLQGKVRGVGKLAKCMHALCGPEGQVRGVALGPFNYPMVLNPENWVDYALYWFGEYESEVGGLFARIIHPNDTVIDIGANIGYYTIGAALAVGAGGRVHAFEPVPLNHGQLLTNIELNRVENVAAVDCAVANSSGWRHVWTVGGNTGASSFSRLEGIDEYKEYFSHGQTSTFTNVRTCTLDDYARERELSRVDVIKMDIEGAELLALQGMCGVVKQFAPDIIMELNPQMLGRLGASASQVTQLLEEWGYRLYRIGKGCLSPLPEGECAVTTVNLYARSVRSGREAPDLCS